MKDDLGPLPARSEREAACDGAARELAEILNEWRARWNNLTSSEVVWLVAAWLGELGRRLSLVERRAARAMGKVLEQFGDSQEAQ